MWNRDEELVWHEVEARRDEAATTRLAREAREEPEAVGRFYWPTMAWLGRALVSLGSRLQARYAVPSPGASGTRQLSDYITYN
jgi:hypothetical protein